MKLKTITIKNFAGIESETISPAHVNVFLGPCGAGKTSRLQAVRFLLYGKDTQSVIKNGCDAATVFAEFEDGTTVERTRTKTATVVKVNGQKTTVKSAKEYIEEKIGVSCDVLKVLCEQDYIDSLNRKDLSRLFLSILPARMSKSSLTANIRTLFGGNITEEEENYILSQFADAEEFGLAEINKAEAFFTEDRKLQKRICQALEAKIEGKPIVLPAETKEELEKQLVELAEKEAAKKNRKETEQKYEKAKQERQIALEKKAEIEYGLKKIGDVSEPDKSKEILLREEKSKFQQAIVKASNLKSTLQTNIRLFQRTLDGLEKPVCPLSDKLTCTTDKRAIKQELEDTIKKNEEDIRQYDNLCRRCDKEIEIRDKELRELSEAKIAYERRQALLGQLKVLTIPSLPPKPEEYTEEEAVQNAIQNEDFIPLPDLFGMPGDKITKRIQGNNAMSEINRKLSAIAEYDAYKELKNQYAKEVHKLGVIEKAVEALDPKKGLGRIIIGKVASSIEDMCNSKAKDFGLTHKIRLDYQDGMEIYVSPKDEAGWIPLANISSGEYVITAYLLLSAINRIENARILMIDSCDKLDKSMLKAFFKMVEKDDTFDHVFIGGVNHTDTVRAAAQMKDAVVTTL